MYNITAKDIRERLDKWIRSSKEERETTELWAIMSDIQLWMADREEEEEKNDLSKMSNK